MIKTPLLQHHVLVRSRDTVKSGSPWKKESPLVFHAKARFSMQFSCNTSLKSLSFQVEPAQTLQGSQVSTGTNEALQASEVSMGAKNVVLLAAMSLKFQISC